LTGDEIRADLMAAGRHLNAKRFGHTVSDTMAKGINFGGCGKRWVVDEVIKALAQELDEWTRHAWVLTTGYTGTAEEIRANVMVLVVALERMDPTPGDIELIREGIKPPHQWAGAFAAMREDPQ